MLGKTPDVIETEYVFTHSYTVRLDSRIGWYTDCSKMGSRSGFGVFRSSSITYIAESLGFYCTLFQAEVAVILTCAWRSSMAVAKKTAKRWTRDEYLKLW